MNAHRLSCLSVRPPPLGEGMAHDETLRIADLKLEVNLSHFPGSGAQENFAGDDGWDKDISSPTLDVARSGLVGNMKRNDDVLSELHTSTPPISVPYPEESNQLGPVAEEIECPHNPRYAEPSPLEQLTRESQPSTRLDTKGDFEPSENSLFEDSSNKPGSSRSLNTRSPYRNFRLETSEQPSQRYHGNQDENSLYYRRKGRDISDRNFPSTPSRQVFFSPVSETFPVDTEIERPTSLTSLSTASPTTEELRTPPEVHRGPLFSPFSASPGIHRAGSLDDPSRWGSVGSPPYGFKPRSYTFGRSSGLRNSVRQGRRSTNPSARSPASAFLSFWSHDEAPPLPDDEGQVVGTEYVIGKQIGFGGFSTVKEAYKVKDEGEPERFAVKIVRKHFSCKCERENDQVQAEFDHEVRVWRYLNHPHILQLDAVYETDYATFCFMKLTTGGTLFDLVRKNRRGVGIHRAKHYAHQLACAIRYLHEDARVVHRDIKLENCLLDFPVSNDPDTLSRLILCDFGMAEWMTTDNGSSSPDPYDDAADRPPPKNIGPSDTSTSIAGSLEYASPELLLAPSGVLNPIVDMWAFGVVVFSMLVGIRPFQDAFQPRIKSNILGGQWDREAVLRIEGHPQERHDALELINGCLEMDCMKRWTIAEVMASPWFRSFADNTYGTNGESYWRF